MMLLTYLSDKSYVDEQEDKYQEVIRKAKSKHRN